MSFDIFLQRFDGEPADEVAVRAVLEPLLAERGDGWDRVVTTDGQADVYGLNDLSTGLMINHAAGRAVWDVIVQVARAGSFAMMPVGCGTFVTETSLLDAVPDGVPEPVAVVQTGAELLRMVEEE